MSPPGPAVEALVTQMTALVLTDVEGSTRLWREQPGPMHAAMTRHAHLVDEVTVRHRGWRPTDQGEGDSAFLAFDSAAAAVAAALDLQRALIREPWPEGAPLRVRIAVGLGEVYPRAGNLYGDAVNRTARVRATAAGGQVVLTAAAAEVVRSALPRGASLRDLGAHRLKDLVSPEQIWQLEHPDLPHEFPPLSSLSTSAHNLPLQPSSFVGREGDLAELVAELRAGQRLLTVTGFGGIGKTRLALQAAAEVSGHLADGVWFVDCSALHDAAEVPVQVGTALGVRDPGVGMGSATLEWLRDRQLLLVLDNLEQVLDAASWVGELLSIAPRVQVLATSREPLRLRGEVDHRIEPLPTPPTAAGGHHDLDRLALNPAVQLFCDRARQVARGFTLTSATAEAVAEICTRLDGLPLAIELAAARVTVLSPADLLVRLELGVPLPASGERDRPERHRTLAAAIAWSADMLLPAERDLLQRLALLPGSSDLATVTAICSDGDDVLDVLTALVDKSLVRVSSDSGVPRFSLLATIRDAMLNDLDPETREQITDRHLEVFRERSIAGAAVSDSSDSGPWDIEKRADAHHFRAAIARAHATLRAHDELLLVANFADLWLEQHLREGISSLQRARAAALRAGDDDVALMAFATSFQAFLHAWSGESEEGMSLAEEGLRLASTPPGDEILAFAYQARGELQSDPSLRRHDLEQAIAIAQSDPDRAVRWGGARPESVELGAASALASLEGFTDPVKARALAASLLDRARGARRPLDVVGAQLLLGYLAADVGDFDAAAEVLEDCLHDLRASGSSATQLLHARAQLALVMDRRDDGAQGVGPLLALAAELEGAGLTANALDLVLRVGDRLRVQGDLAGARDAWLRADRLCATVGAGRTHWASWRLAQLERLSGGDPIPRLEAAWADLRPLARRWLPDALSVLVEAALLSEERGDTNRAAVLAATADSHRHGILLRLPVTAEFAEMCARYPSATPLKELPEALFATELSNR